MISFFLFWVVFFPPKTKFILCTWVCICLTVCVQHNSAGAHEGHKETIPSSGAGVTECGELVAIWVGARNRTLEENAFTC